jgi:branched-chain amino acid transport system permease protein
MSEQSDSDERRLGGRLNPLALPLRHKLGLLGLGFLVALPLLVSLPVVGPLVVALLPANSWEIGLVHMTGALFVAMFAMSWDAVSGYTGEISFGHGLFFAVGGYTSALVSMGHGLPVFVSIPLGVALAVVAGLVIGVPSLRLEGPYLSLVTLIAPLILLQLFIFRSDVFGGELGIDAPELLIEFSYVNYYFLALGLFVAVFALLWVITRSNTGAILTGVREDEDAVAAAGLNPAKFKIYAFALSAAVGGLAGAVYVHTPGVRPHPDTLFSLLINVEVIIAAVLGGMGTIVGAAVGGIFVSLAPKYLNLIEFTVPVLGHSVSEMSQLLFVLVTLLLLNVFPGGLVRWGIGLGRKAIGRDDPSGATTADGGKPPEAQTIEKYREHYRRLFGGSEK